MTRCVPQVPLLAIWLALSLAPPPSLAQAADAQTALSRALHQISGEQMLIDVTELSTKFDGRQAGTEDDLRSAQWMITKFRQADLAAPVVRGFPPIPSFSQGRGGSSLGVMASMIPTSIIEPPALLKISAGGDAVSRQLGTEYLPILDSPAANVQGSIVFVGYGLVDPAHQIDDYAGVDVKNSIVLFLRGKPDYYPPQVSHADKVRIAREKGAIGYLTATGPVLSPYEARRGVTGSPSAFYGLTGDAVSLPGAWISTGLAEELLAGPTASQPGTLRARQEQLNKAPTPQAIRTDRFGALSWNATPVEGPLINVLGLIQGVDPHTGQEAVIVGAHRDHFGTQAGLPFPGADDNASGTAVMLEAARALSRMPRPKRSILFISFSGEERGLLGSRLYVGRPVVPLNHTKAMINIDHAGIGDGRLTVGVTGLDKQIAQEAGLQAGLADRLDLFGFFPGGDHVPFKEAGVPTVTVVSGGVHPHFHQPTDRADTINPEILQSAARYVVTLAWQLANTP